MAYVIQVPHAFPSSGPILVDAATTSASLPFDRLVPILRDAFIAGADAPLRHRHALPGGASLLLMPAWHARALLGVKIVTVFPGNGLHGLNAVNSTYLLCDGETGRHLAIIDGNEITGRRTVAASALAGSFLARADASDLLLVGAGHIASLLPAAWSIVRPIARVRIWNPRPERAVDLAIRLRLEGFNAEAAKDLRMAVRGADIVSCATLALNPLVSGAWLKPGAHLDLIGGFTPAMREADDEAVTRARIFIDSEAALVESGDLSQPIARGVITPADVVGTLQQLCRGEVAGRRDDSEVTLFKSVGTALEDLAAASLVHQALGG